VKTTDTPQALVDILRHSFKHLHESDNVVKYGVQRAMARRSLSACSFATIRFFAVFRQTMNTALINQELTSRLETTDGDGRKRFAMRRADWSFPKLGRNL